MILYYDTLSKKHKKYIEMSYLNKKLLNKPHISVEIYDLLAVLRLPNQRVQKMKRPDMELTSVMCGSLPTFLTMYSQTPI